MLKVLGVISKLGVAGIAGSITLDQCEVVDLSGVTVMRAVRTGITTARIIKEYKFSLYNLESGSEEYEEALSKAHTRSAKKILKLVWRNRGVYVKVGQHLGGMDYLLPKEYTDILKVLHSSAPQSSVESIKQVIKEDLKIDDVDDVFEEFSVKPLGTASLAQVHRAKLKKDGQVVAVKVQHPTIQYHAGLDMDMMESALILVSRIFPNFELMWVSEETKKNLPRELNFQNEVNNCLRATENLKCFSWVKLPKIYTEFCTPRVLTMEFMEGGQVNDDEYLKKHNIDPSVVTRKLGRLFSEMIFVHGFVHSDPHPGNILVRRKDQQHHQTSSSFSLFPTLSHDTTNDLEIILLDHGLYRELTEDFRYNYSHLWQSIINHNLRGIERYARKLGSAEMYPLLATIVTGRSWEVVSDKGVKNVDFTHEEDTELRDNVGGFLPDISHVLNHIPREMLLVLKTNDQLRGLEHAYGVRGHKSGFLDMSKCCLRAMQGMVDRKVAEREPDTKQSALRLYVSHFSESFKIRFDLFKIAIYEWYMWAVTQWEPQTTAS